MSRLIALVVLVATLGYTTILPLVAQQDDLSALRLLPGDAIRVAIWQEEELSGEFLVDEEGVTTFPMLGARRVVDQSVGDLRRSLVEEYRKFLRNPSISVTPLRRINVLGAVNAPGVYSVDPTTSLAGVVALAGGTVDTDLKRIRIVRADGMILNRVGSERTLHTVGIRSGDQIFVLRPSWLARNGAFVVPTILTLATTFIVTIVTTSIRS